MAAAKETIDKAMRQHREGRWPEAETLFRQILAEDPHCPEALHGLGLLALEAGQKDAALELLSHAVAVKPDAAPAHFNLGMVLALQNRVPEAISCWRRAIAVDPKFAEAHFSLGDGLIATNQLEEAVDILRRGLLLRPQAAGALNNLGVALMRLGRSDEAIDALRKAVQTKPDSADSWMTLGNMLLTHQRADEAIACYSRAMALRPKSPDAFMAAGTAMRRANRLAEAERLEQDAAKLQPIAKWNKIEPRWRGYEGPPVVPGSQTWKAIYLPPQEAPRPTDSPELKAIYDAAFAPGLPDYKDLFCPNDQPLPGIRPEDWVDGKCDWLMSPISYPAEFGIFRQIARSGRPLRMLEIGVYTGLTGVTFFKAVAQPALYVGVDPNVYARDGLTRAAESFRQLRAGGMKFEYILLEGYSWDQPTQNTLAHTGPFDIVRVDGDHTLPSKLIDLELAAALCAPGGYVLVDDYVHHPCVKDAVSRAMALGMYREFCFVPTLRGLAILRS
jgi:tetratricopeptide (TPR) repeat protein/predicted O-methyltransferase YrrM